MLRFSKWPMQMSNKMIIVKKSSHIFFLFKIKDYPSLKILLKIPIFFLWTLYLIFLSAYEYRQSAVQRKRSPDPVFFSANRPHSNPACITVIWGFSPKSSSYTLHMFSRKGDWLRYSQAG